MIGCVGSVFSNILMTGMIFNAVDQETKKIEYQQLLGVLEQTRKMSRARDVLISNLEKDNEILHEKRELKNVVSSSILLKNKFMVAPLLLI